MLSRLLTLPPDRSFFLFGARNTGKSTLIRLLYDLESTYWINLLDPNEEEKFARNPSELLAIVRALPVHITHVVIDEIQKIPALLDVVHLIMEENKKLYFILTGSSARKLKRGAANLLAGRAFVYHLFPFSYIELANKFNLDDALRWGMLPKVCEYQDDDDRLRFLQAYTQTYLKEEVWFEHLIRKLDPFRKFLEVSAQCNAKIINMASIAKDVGVDEKTIKEYFSLLEDTLIGFLLEPFKNSFRKRLSAHPKFYYFDTGVVRALARYLTVPLVPSTSAYGDAFEHFIILECMKLASYFYPEYRFSYLKTKDDVEVDLIVERPGMPHLFIEIKSANHISQPMIQSFINITKDFGECEAVCFSKDKELKKYDNVTIFHWEEGVKKYFFKPE